MKAERNCIRASFQCGLAPGQRGGIAPGKRDGFPKVSCRSQNLISDANALLNNLDQAWQSFDALAVDVSSLLTL